MALTETERKSLAETLWEKAATRARARDLLKTDKLWELALEAAFFTIELPFDAALIAIGREKDELKAMGHSLKRLVELPGAGASDGYLLTKMRGKENKEIRKDFNVLSSAWSMHYRYERHPDSDETKGKSLETFERFYTWILKNLK